MFTLSGRLPKLPLTALFIPVAFAYSGFSYADLTSQVKEIKLNEVTVFLRGAELFNSAQIDLPAGDSEVIFTNIASDINVKTLLIGTDSKALVKSSLVKRDYLADNNTPEIEKLQSEIKDIQEKLRLLQVEQRILDAQLNLLEENTRLSGENTVATVGDIKGMWDFVGTQMKDALKSKLELEKQANELNKKLNSLQQQVQSQHTKNVTPGNQLVVRFYSEKPVSTNVHLSYAIQNANWVPTYDVSVEKINAPVKFTYKASVAQASGISWDNVRLKLSTGNLNQSVQAPTLRPHYLSFFEPSLYTRTKGDENISYAAPAPVMELAKKETQQNISNKQKMVASSLNDYVVTNVNGINTTFDIALNYSIPSDAQPHLVSIKEESVKGDYRYFVAPKLNANAYLQVQIADWQKLNLLPGKSNVYFEGSFIGEGNINVNDIQDENMNISLGRDAKIIVNRQNTTDMKSKPEFFGNNVTQQYGYAINIKNTRPEAIKLIVVDQVPVSNNEAIVISDVKYNQTAKWEKETGEIEWTLNMPANSAEKLLLSYSVKYPKDKQISGL